MPRSYVAAGNGPDNVHGPFPESPSEILAHGQPVAAKPYQRDHPLNFVWRPAEPDELVERLGLRSPWSRDHAIVRGYVLGYSIVVARKDPGAWISYSRNRNFYAERRRYWPARCMYASVISVIDELADLGLFEHERMPPGNLGWQSRFRATAELIRMSTDQPPLRLTCDRRERIILRDSKGRPLGYDDTEATHRMRGRLTSLNEALTSIVVALDGEVIAEGAPLTTTQNRIGAATLTLHRVFNESFQLGGRFYGMWPQNIPKELRRKITIDGSPTSEPDFPEHHLRLLYARCEQNMPTAPFEIDGWPRKVVKIATYTLINASTPTSALRAIAFDLTGPGAYDEARRLISAIEAKHSAIAHAFNSGAGLRLMRLDSEITERIELGLLKHGIVALPVHDSYVVPARAEQRTREVMAEAFDSVVTGQRKRTAGIRQGSATYDESRLQYGYPPLSLGVWDVVRSILRGFFFPGSSILVQFGRARVVCVPALSRTAPMPLTATSPFTNSGVSEHKPAVHHRAARP